MSPKLKLSSSTKVKKTETEKKTKNVNIGKDKKKTESVSESDQEADTESDSSCTSIKSNPIIVKNTNILDKYKTKPCTVNLIQEQVIINASDSDSENESDNVPIKRKAVDSPEMSKTSKLKLNKTSILNRQQKTQTSDNNSHLASGSKTTKQDDRYIALRQLGFTDADIDTIVLTNPPKTTLPTTSARSDSAVPAVSSDISSDICETTTPAAEAGDAFSNSRLAVASTHRKISYFTTTSNKTPTNMRRGGYFRRRKTPSPSPPQFEHINRYAPLQTDDNDNENNMEEENEEETSTTQTQAPRRQAPAPIVIIREAQNYKDITNMLRNITGGGFYMNYTRNNINVYLDKKEHKKQIIQKLKENKIQFHTYTDPDEKTHAFVLRGLDFEPTIEQIEKELVEQHQLPVKKIYTMRTKYRPLYLVITTAEVALKEMQNKIKHIMYTKVSWERHKNKRILTQCHQCQNFGHATSNCSRAPRCVKCEGAHLTQDCTKDAEAKAKCCNCGGDHPANYKKCTTYTTKLEQIAKRNPRIHRKLAGEPEPTQFVPAPPPVINPWTPGPSTSTRSSNFPPLPPPQQRRRFQTTTKDNMTSQPPNNGHNPPQNTLVINQTPSDPRGVDGEWRPRGPSQPSSLVV